MVFKYDEKIKEEVKWYSYPQTKILGGKILDRFEWNDFLVYHTTEDIHFFREPPQIDSDNYFTDYALVSQKNRTVTFKEEKLLGIVPYGNTMDKLSILTYKTSSASKDGNMNRNFPIFQS